MAIKNFVLLLLCAIPSWCFNLALPNKPGSVRFAIIGDNGTGGKPEYEVGRVMAECRASFPFTSVLMMGDNLYGGAKPGDYIKKFQIPYQPLLEAGVKFYASLGNHDDRNELSYAPFHMDGRPYYTFATGSVRFFALDSNQMDAAQLQWIERELRDCSEPWKIAFFHHPLYSTGRKHGPSIGLRAKLEPLFVKYHVNAVFSGHEHFYERIKPQQGINYFISGGAGQLRAGDISQSDSMAKGFDQDRHFMLVEISGDEMYFQAVSRLGETVDSGVVRRLADNSAVAVGAP